MLNDHTRSKQDMIPTNRRQYVVVYSPSADYAYLQQPPNLLVVSRTKGSNKNIMRHTRRYTNPSCLFNQTYILVRSYWRRRVISHRRRKIKVKKTNKEETETKSKKRSSFISTSSRLTLLGHVRRRLSCFSRVVVSWWVKDPSSPSFINSVMEINFSMLYRN